MRSSFWEWIAQGEGDTADGLPCHAFFMQNRAPALMGRARPAINSVVQGLSNCGVARHQTAGCDGEAHFLGDMIPSIASVFSLAIC